MTDFKEAFRRGLASSEEADRRRSEAEEVIEDFVRQISDGSEGKLTLYLDETYVQKSARMMAGIVNTMTGAAHTPGAGKRTHAIFAEVRVGNASAGHQSICLVTFAPSTYPIELQWETEVRICHDREDLGSGLHALAEDPRTGKKFRQMIERYPSVVSMAAKALAAPASESTDAEEDERE